MFYKELQFNVNINDVFILPELQIVDMLILTTYCISCP